MMKISAVTGPRIDVDLCVSTYSTLKSSSIHGAYDKHVSTSFVRERFRAGKLLSLDLRAVSLDVF